MSAKDRRVMWMHTINERPATFSPPDGQIVFADNLPGWRDTPTPATLRASVARIKKDQAVTRRNRESWGMKDDAGRYGYVKVVVRA